MKSFILLSYWLPCRHSHILNKLLQLKNIKNRTKKSCSSKLQGWGGSGGSVLQVEDETVDLRSSLPFDVPRSSVPISCSVHSLASPSISPGCM